jgi:ribosome-associated protein
MTPESEKLTKRIYDILNQKKLTQIDILDVHHLTTLSDVFVIVTAANSRQTKALADELDTKLALEGVSCYQQEGYETATWILMDYSDVMVHILVEEEATFYGLDRLWQDGNKIIF